MSLLPGCKCFPGLSLYFETLCFVHFPHTRRSVVGNWLKSSSARGHPDSKVVGALDPSFIVLAPVKLSESGSGRSRSGQQVAHLRPGRVKVSKGVVQQHGTAGVSYGTGRGIIKHLQPETRSIAQSGNSWPRKLLQRTRSHLHLALFGPDFDSRALVCRCHCEDRRSSRQHDRRNDRSRSLDSSSAATATGSTPQVSVT